MEFGSGPQYMHPMDREYDQLSLRPEADVYAEGSQEADIEGETTAQSLISSKEIGTTVTEGGRFGTFRQSMQQAIFQGTSRVELSAKPTGGMEGGVEAYGKEAREEIRDLAKFNEVEITSVHVPPEAVGNLSGFNPQHGFSHEQRRRDLDEVNRAIRFAAEVAQGGAIVVHTGEFPRPIESAAWNKEGKFIGYDEEPTNAITYMVDDRTGQVLQSVRKSQEVYEPEYERAKDQYADKFKQGNAVYDSSGRLLKENDLVDMNGNYLDPFEDEDLFKRVPKWDTNNTRFKVVKRDWNYFERLKDEYNKAYPDKDPLTAEEMFYRTQMQNQILTYRGNSLYHARMYEREKQEFEKVNKSIEYFKKLKESMTPEQWEQQKEVVGRGDYFVPPDIKDPLDYLEFRQRELANELKHIHESSAAADAEAAKINETIDHIKPVSSYALNQSMKSFAEAGINAMKATDEYGLKRDIFVAPENIFPEMGYGSHPEELIELVTKSRKKMVEFLTSDRIPDPEGHLDPSTGKLMMVVNPYKVHGMTEDNARKEAEHHLKATLDTQHLGMWWKHFKPEAGETEEARRERFNKWYMEQVEELDKKGIIGHVHIVDSLGGGHHHLPAGQGDLPVVDAVTYLKNKGYTKNMSLVSEGFGFGEAQRQLTETWAAFGTKIHGAPRPGVPTRFADVEHSYFGTARAPYYVFGAYSPSNDWTLWTQVPLE